MGIRARKRLFGREIRPVTTETVISFGQHAARSLVRFSLALGLLTGPAVAVAKPASGLSGLDLRLSPNDVAPPQPPVLPGSPEPSALHRQNIPEIVGEIDQVQRSDAPQKRTVTGPLESLSGNQSVLKELLENRTIPLFRVSVPPPF
jgi:hypothetical protein